MHAAPKRVFSVDSRTSANAARAKRTAYVRSLSEADMLAMVPTQSGIYFTDCPNCDGGAQDRADWKWTPEKPGQLTCKSCGETYPGNAKHPDDQMLRIAAPGGVEHVYPYHERADGYRIFFRAHADFLARKHMAVQCQDLARQYAATGDENYGRRAALILDRFAQVYPGYAYKFDYPFREKLFSPCTKSTIKGIGAYRVSKWSWWAYMGVSQELIEAYDALRFWPGLDGLGAGGARKRIEEDLLGGMMHFVMAIPETYTNMSPCMWRQFLYAGRVMGRDDWVEETLQRVDTFMRDRLLYDGFWLETSPSYCQQVVGAMNGVLKALDGYEAPQDAGAELEQILQRVRSSVRALKRAYASVKKPDGADIPVNDTWARRGRGRARTESRLLPGLGLAMLGGGEGGRQVLAWLNFTGGSGHKHNDALSIGLCGHGEELLRDIGYTHTAWRTWGVSMMSHNSVVVNGVESGRDREHRDNRLRCFVTDRRGFHLTEAESLSAYAGTTTRYRRALMLVGADGSDAYLVDVFQVHGGTQHDWLLHGSASEDSTALVGGVALQSFDGTLMNPGTKFSYPKGESFGVGAAGAFGFIRRLQKGTAADAITLDLRLSSKSDIGTRTWLDTGGDATVFLGEAPRLRQAERRDDLLPTFKAPAFCTRRTGDNLQSAFVAVHAPVSGAPTVRAVHCKRLEGGVVVTIDRGDGRRDYAVIGFDGPLKGSVQTDDGILSFDAHWAIARANNGLVDELHLVDGTRIGLGDTVLDGEQSRTGVVRDWACAAEGKGRGWLEIPESLPALDLGTSILLTFADGTVHGFTPLSMEPVAGGVRIVVSEAPAFERDDDGIRFTAYPKRGVKGQEVGYSIPATRHLHRRVGR